MRIVRESENRYVAYDDNNREAGFSTVTLRELPRIFPDRPVQIEISVQSTDESRFLLYGASVTRACALAMKNPGRCRVYAAVDPENTEDLKVLQELGFERADGVCRMTRGLPGSIPCEDLPEGCIVIRDRLESEAEKEKCLRRYNECFGEHKDMEWLNRLTLHQGFTRILLVSDKLCGEVLLWSVGLEGVVGVIQVPLSLRRKGFGTILMEQARQYFAEIGMEKITFDAWRRSPGCWELAKKSDFTPSRLIEEYPELKF